MVADKLLTKPADEWLKIFDENDMWAGPVYSYAEVVTDPQVEHNKSLLTYEHPTEGTVTTPGFPIKFERSPSELRMGAPLTGQHSREVLAEIGIPSARIEDLIRQRIVSVEE
jgi:crotonobetainyl-CoA:carnitine CoA-transferase CaiB-like acyl-CoA transferase